MSVFIKSLHLKNILSFKDTKLDLQPLNVLIGPNGSGKSNLIDVIGLLQAVPNDIAEFLRRNGPTRDWVWKGHDSDEKHAQTAEISAVVDLTESCIAYDLGISVSHDLLRALSERIDVIGLPAGGQRPSSLVLRSENSAVQFWPERFDDDITTLSSYSAGLIMDKIHPHESVLRNMQLVEKSRTLERLLFRLHNVKIYRDWRVGRNSAARNLQRTDGDPNFLAEDFSNLALVVNDLLSRRLEPSLSDYLKRFYESYESLHPRIFGNTIELIVNEAGMSTPLPASRLSDGTIRFIALLAILCHPEPPPLICIEEPEIAMHPDSQDLVVELLKKASERTQLIVTTHSPWLIDRLSAKPEQVLVCDRRPGEGTQFKRFTRAELEDWLEDQPLGEVWMAGALGGVH